MLEAQAVTVSLGGKPILRGLGFTLQPGELVGLIGANGSGKSTLLRALTGLLPLESGEIRLEGKPLPRIDPREAARKLAYLPQNPQCHWPLTAGSVVALGRLPYRGSTSELDAGHVARALSALDALHLRDRVIHELSGGERARIFLARALAGDPALLLADEPAAGLDPRHQLQLMETLRGLARDGRGVLLALHDLEAAARFCDRLVLLDNGQTAATGAPSEVLTDELLARCYGVRAFRGCHDGQPVLVPWDRIG